MKGTGELDLYRQLMAGLLVQNGGELRISKDAINAVYGDMEICDDVDYETGDVILKLVKVAQPVG